MKRSISGMGFHWFVLVALTASWWGAVAFWVTYNVFHLGLRSQGVRWGYREGPAVLLTLDNCGIAEETYREVVARLSKKGIKQERLAIACSHTHTTAASSGFSKMRSAITSARAPCR